MYSARLLDHFQNPRHTGEVSGPGIRVTVDNPACGDILELSAIVDDGVIRSIRFRAKGCVPSMACGSALCELAQGRRTEVAMKLTREELLQEVGGVPQASQHAIQLALDALHKLLRQTPDAL